MHRLCIPLPAGPGRAWAVPLALAGLLALSACSGLTPSIYKLDMRQGNVLEEETVAQLRPGMSKGQVQNLLGTPALVDPFHLDRWDYVYLYYPRGDRERGEERRVTLFFEGDLLTRVEPAAVQASVE